MSNVFQNENLEDIVVHLKRDSVIDLQPTDKPTSYFTIMKRNLIIQDFYDGLLSYDIFSGNKKTKIPLENQVLRDFATDGNYLYLQIINGPDFKLKSNDILLGDMRLETYELINPLTLIKDVKQPSRFIEDHMAFEQGIRNRIVCVPENFFNSRSYVFDINAFTEKFFRILIPDSIPGSTILHQGDRYVYLSNSNFDESPLNPTYIKNGKIIDLDQTKKSHQSLLDNIHIDFDLVKNEYRNRIWSNLNIPEVNGEGKIIYSKIIPISIVGDIPNTNLINSIYKSGDHLYVLHKESGDIRNPGQLSVEIPAHLEIYQISIKRLADI